MEECNICFDDKAVTIIKCCIGKKWCKECEDQIKNIQFPKCPFCRTALTPNTPSYYFNYYTPMQTIIPPTIPVSSGIYIYSFSLYPQNNQPSGSVTPTGI